MKQLYTKKAHNGKMQPKPETVRFLLNFSKSLVIVKTQTNHYVEFNLN